MSAELIFVAFLECQKISDPDFRSELQCIVQALSKDGDLQTDSHTGISFRELQTDGGPEPEIDEDLCRRIGAQLAQLGDQFEQEGTIKAEVVECLVNDILNKSLTEDRFADAVKRSLHNLPPGMDLERATVAIAMSLTSKVGSNVPNLLQDCYSTALTFISSNYRSCIDQLTRQG
ncbi:BH3-interacting domain death agonist [Anomaloglossus baeobatrachus]|uniref:BH3-interacting domain death agonist n=1 Tax=Anomaloglossus baeobatrachus TaxID=238106 RepID=UPI003F4F43B0